MVEPNFYKLLNKQIIEIRNCIAWNYFAANIEPSTLQVAKYRGNSVDFWLPLPWIQTETTILTPRITNDSLGTFREHQFFSSEKQGNHDNSFGYFWKVTKLFSLFWSYHPAKAQSNILTKQKMQACQSSLKSRIFDLDSKILRGWHSNVFLYSGVRTFYFQSFPVSSLRSSYANLAFPPHQ